MLHIPYSGKAVASRLGLPLILGYVYPRLSTLYYTYPVDIRIILRELSSTLIEESPEG